MKSNRKESNAWVAALENVLAPEDLQRVYRQKASGKDPFEFLIDQKMIAEEKLLAILSSKYNMPYLLLDRYFPDVQALRKLSIDAARRFQIFPLFELGEDFYVATSDPTGLEPEMYIRKLTGMNVEMVLASPQSIKSAQNRHYFSKTQSARILGDILEQKSELEAAATGVHVEDAEAPIIKLVEHILSQAVHLKASDIHLEPYEKQIGLRYRIDGILHEFPPPPRELFRSIVSRIKILSNLDITERRLPQDGRARIEVDEAAYDLRVSVIPSLRGEGVVIRVLDATRGNIALESLGFFPDLLKRYERLINKPYGIILVTGPTGCGKTTTLYSTIKKIFNSKRKIITLEDPVEYEFEGITQIQVNSEIGLTFGNGLRSVLRHDPDVILLGEIRDLESAEIAIRSSLTGHLVLSTLHTNDSVSAVVRLVDMGVDSHLVLSSLICVLAQRLLRRLCSECKEPYKPSASDMAGLGISHLPEEPKAYRAKGCRKCHQLGYRGRIAVGELLEISTPMRRLASDQIVPLTLREIAQDRNFVSLRRNAAEIFFSGLTSLEEVLSVTDVEG